MGIVGGRFLVNTLGDEEGELMGDNGMNMAGGAGWAGAHVLPSGDN